MRRVLLNIAFACGAPPSEFRIFTAGIVDTAKGAFVFDEAAAALVMAEYEKHGIDLMLDYDHASLGTDRSPDPAQAGKAAGWFNLEVRDGELWAVNVRWTPPAAEALARKEWRFMSPAFTTDENGRVTSLLNVAITNLPATRNLQPLMAASLLKRLNSMNPEAVQKALDALIAGDTEACAELLKGMIADAASGGEPAEAAPEAPAEMAKPAEEPAAEEPKPEEDEEKKAAAVVTSRLIALTGAGSVVAALAAVEAFKASHLELETERQRLAAERATLEASERRRGCVDLVVKAGRAPSTVWADDKCSAPKKYLSAMPIEDFRDYVADSVKAGSKAPAPKAPKAPSGETFETPDGPYTLSASELRICAETKCDPKVYAASKAKQLKARGGR
jgi:phage I-like protein